MKRITLTICGVVFAAFFTVGKAQTAEETKKWMEFMTPSDVHKMMAKSDGQWNEEMQFWMAPDAPAQSMKASCINKMILGGRYQESVHTGEFGGMPFEGHSTTGWDNARKIIFATWIDNMGTGLTYMEGTWNETTNSIEMKGKMTDPMTGNIADIRETLKFVDDDTQIMQQFGMKDGKEYKTMEIKLTRVK
jgi:Protein of unknown function (DUF1579)